MTSFFISLTWIEEPDVKATLTERDAPIYNDNDVELFMAGKDAYYEFEINAYARGMAEARTGGLLQNVRWECECCAVLERPGMCVSGG